MRATLDIDENLLKALQERAVSKGETVETLIEETLREAVRDTGHPSEPYQLQWVVVRGRALPEVDTASRDALLERMEGRS